MNELIFVQQDVLPALMKGLEVSMMLILPSGLCGVVLGVLVGVLRVYGSRWVISLTNGYVTIFRGFPLVVQLFIWYFGLPHIGIYLTPFLASVICSSLCSAASHSVSAAGAFLSLKKG